MKAHSELQAWRHNFGTREVNAELHAPASLFWGRLPSAPILYVKVEGVGLNAMARENILGCAGNWTVIHQSSCL
jgi:hypothetical protein